MELRMPSTCSLVFSKNGKLSSWDRHDITNKDPVVLTKSSSTCFVVFGVLCVFLSR